MIVSIVSRVGGDSKIQYLVLQVHYAHIDMIPETGDDSGMTNQAFYVIFNHLLSSFDLAVGGNRTMDI